MTGEHRGYTYHIVLQVGGGWRWTVEHDGKEKTGSKRFRDDSIRHAKRCIDELIRKADIKEAERKPRPMLTFVISTLSRAH